MSTTASSGTSARVHIRTCPGCGTPVVGGRGACIDCIRAEQKRERDHDARISAEAFERGYKRGRADALFDEVERQHFGLPTVVVGVEGFSQADLRDLVQLTHPDRHPVERAELANRITAIVLRAMGK